MDIQRFVAAIDAEIAFIESEGRDQTFKLLSGERDPSSSGLGGVYVFVLADPLRLPEDAAGRLKVGDKQFQAMVVAQEGNRIWLLVEADEQLPRTISSASLELSQTELLAKLKERLEEIRGADGMAEKVFHPEKATVDWRDLPVSLDGADESMKLALQKCFGSEVTFLWGPPGTGKTFSIAQLAASFLETGQTVLVTSHTHAAVEQALWAAVEPPTETRSRGPLFGSSYVEEGKVLKVGPLRQPKIPKKCHLDSYLEEVASERNEQVAALLVEQTSLRETLKPLERELEIWGRLDAADEKASRYRSETELALSRLGTASTQLEKSKGLLAQSRLSLERARSSFFIGRKGRTQRATVVVHQQSKAIQEAERSLMGAESTLHELREKLQEAEKLLVAAQAESKSLRDRALLMVEYQPLRLRRDGIDAQVKELREVDPDLANRLLDEALCIFTTLTKLYMSRELRERTWDTVIIDEVSMAMPPLVALAASKARERVILVGDFYQLPPIVHSRDGIAFEELGTDIFEATGIPPAVESNNDPAYLAQLTVQRRMHPEIADVARTLVYKNRLTDHESTARRALPEWISASLGTENPLVVVDLADLNTWAGKMPGNMSRFNFYSAQACVEIASLYAAQIPAPHEHEAPPIAILTPYAAQRRYLARLVESLGLAAWVAPGTVHTFQGNECDVIIFDTVLAEPQWTARFTNPHMFSVVRRDLNVAVTRARHQFVFVGDSVWLRKYARAASGYGALWNHLQAAAKRLDAIEVLGDGFRNRVAVRSAATIGWSQDRLPGKVAFLDEKSFYPAFVRDLQGAMERVILFTPFIGKTRWPLIEPQIARLPRDGVLTVLLHKPLEEWQGDPRFGEQVLTALDGAGVRLLPLQGIHAKTIVIDGRIVYDGSLNWASQTASYEHMWRMESKEMASLVEKMLQLDALLNGITSEAAGTLDCPKCGGELILLNQRERAGAYDTQPLKLGCRSYAKDKKSCQGYLRGVHDRAPFRVPPECEKGKRMTLKYGKTGKPWAWQCGHKTCRNIRWKRGDIEA